MTARRRSSCTTGCACYRHRPRQTIKSALRSPLQTAIEQRIARGWSDERISAEVLCSVDEVADCRNYLDTLIYGPPPSEIIHGLAGYRRGCDCSLCIEANRDRVRRQTPKARSCA